MSYEHTQHGKLQFLLYPMAVGMLAMSVLQWGRPVAGVALLAAALLTAFVTACFHHLTVRSEGDALRLSYGPLPLFGKRLPFREIRSAKRSRSAVIDGWGIHAFPGRGWTWNLWGRDCVLLETKRGLLRIGTDDPDRLAAFLTAKLAG